MQAEADQSQALCHCGDCRKLSGSLFSTNFIIPKPKVTKGQPKEYVAKADSGRSLTSYFCGDCGTTLWRAGEAFGDNAVLKVGVLDDQDTLAQKPSAELYAKRRPAWLPSIDGAALKQEMS